MIQIKTRTEFSFREVYGPLDLILKSTEGPIGICDRGGTWGHIAFWDACKKAGRKALLGLEVAVVENAASREKQGINWMPLIAKNNAGLQELYELVSTMTSPDHFYYTTRVDYSDIMGLSENVIILSGSTPVWGSLPVNHKHLYIELSASSQFKALDFAKKNKLQLVATSDNFFPTVGDRNVYEIVAGQSRENRTTPMHLLNDWEWQMLWPDAPAQALANQAKIAAMCEVTIPQATMPVIKHPKTLMQLCKEGAKKRGINLKDKVYMARLEREIKMIDEKKFQDYFYIVHDMLAYAKKHMLVGPARGSSCGSLVCYLLSITEIDPIPYELLFERFIDINRKDLPDIDIDFPDDRRDMVFTYLDNKYGANCVARLGTIMRYKAKSAIDDVARGLEIPAWELADLKGAIIERSGGDARAAFCILDTFNELEVGKEALAKYPQLKVAARIENHARTSGQHAAGIVITALPITNYCSVDRRTGAAQVDKHDAESINLLKIDALGLRTLSVIQDCLDQVGWSREKLMAQPTDYEGAYRIIQAKKYSGIFQFEGYALQSLSGQMKIENFEDIAAMTALARPGPLESGGASEYIKRRTGQHETVHLHPLIAHTTKLTYGIIIYQEQVMQIAREMGDLSWEDVSSLRKAMSKSLGKEFFDGFWMRFRDGALKQGVAEDDAKRVWDNINTMGSWSFNRSHAISYGMVSYWTAMLKAMFPLEFAAACLRNARDEEQSVRQLRELHREGFTYKAFDEELSQKNWSVQNGVLIGGLLNVKGIGDKSADDIIARRNKGESLTAGQRNKLANASTPFDMVFECDERWGHIKSDPLAFKITTPITDIAQIGEEDSGDFLIFGKIKDKNLRDMNDLNGLKKRNGKRVAGQSMTLILTVEDDSGNMRVRIDRHNYIKLGLPIVEGAKIGDWYMFKGNVSAGFRSMNVMRYRRLTGSDAERR